MIWNNIKRGIHTILFIVVVISAIISLLGSFMNLLLRDTQLSGVVFGWIMAIIVMGYLFYMLAKGLWYRSFFIRRKKQGMI